MRVLVLLVVLSATALAQPKRKPGKPVKPKLTQPVKASAPAPTPAPNEVSREDGEIVLRFFNHFIDMVAAAKGDCSAIAVNINFVVDRNRELIRKIAEATEAGKQFPKFVNEAMMKRLNELMPIVQKCADDPDVEAAMKRMEPRKKQPPIN